MPEGWVNWRWVAGLFLAAFMAVSGVTWSMNISQIVALESRVRNIEQSMQGRGERMAIAEVRLQDVRVDMQNINRKLDVLLKAVQ